MKKSIAIALLIVLIIPFMPKSAEAAVDFGVRAIIPKNQINKKKTYFDLKMKPGQTQKITVELINKSKKAMTIETKANQAITNKNGVIDYSKPASGTEGLFSNVVKVPKETKLKPKSSKKITATITMPKKRYDGIWLGGLYFIEKKAEQKNTSKKKAQMTNKYAYIIGLSLKETNEKVVPGLELEKLKWNSDMQQLQMEIQNQTAAIANNLIVQTVITETKTKKQVAEYTESGFKMAPNSVFQYDLSLENKQLPPGNYSVAITSKSDAEVWSWNDKFTIEGKKANEKKTKQKRGNLSIWWYICCGALAIGLAIIIVLLINRQKRKKRRKKRYKPMQ